MESQTKEPIVPTPAYVALEGSALHANRAFYDKVAESTARELQESFRVPIRSGRAWRVPAGHICRISTPEGPQVGDLNIWNLHNPKERFWASRTKQLQASHVTTYDRLWSCLPFLRPMVTIVGDSLGGDKYGTDVVGGRVHDLLGTRCDPYVNKMLTGDDFDYHCHSNLTRAVLPWGLTEFDVHDVINIFQVTGLNKDDKYFMRPCPAKAGDYIEFFAEIDVLMALSTCPGGDLSAWAFGGGATDMLATCRPLDVKVWKLTDNDVLKDWEPFKSPKYEGLHGIKFTNFGKTGDSKTSHSENSYDVVVVGSGCAGLTSALVTAKHGLRVLVLEKTRYFGGTTAYSGGGAWIPNNKHQPAIGVKDSGPQAETYLRKVLKDLYDPTKIPVFLKSGPEMVEWLEANSEVRFKPVPLPDYHVSKDGASAGRTILTVEFDGRKLGSLIKDVRYPLQGYSAFGSMQADPAELSILTDPFGSIGNLTYSAKKVIRYAMDLIRWGKGTSMANGNALVGRLLYSAREQGVQLWNNAAAIKTVIEGGRVVGVKVIRDDTETTIHAHRGVILASGGFGRSEEAKQFVPHEWCAAPRGNTGDGKRMGVESGGALPPKNPMNAIFAPISLRNVSTGPVRRFPHFAIDRSKPGSIIVGPDGRRFANESDPYQEFVTAMHEKGIKKAYYIGDRIHLRKYGMGMALPWPYPVWNLLRQGYLLSAPSIPALAHKLGVPVENLTQTVKEFNHYAETGKDRQYNRGGNVYDQFYGDPKVQPNPNLGTCTKGPFYALPLYPGNVSTLYGLITNIDAQVLDKDGQVVKGLYAVGCDQNSVFKGAYPGGGSSIGPGMTFGYRAALSLAEVEH